jgi:hypothetical protein
MDKPEFALLALQLKRFQLLSMVFHIDNKLVEDALRILWHECRF